jgi:predicted Zn-dependent protease
MLELGELEYNEKQQVKRVWWGLLGAGAGAAIGGAAGRSGTAAGYGLAGGAVAGYVAGAIMNQTMHLDWDKVQEDEADQVAFKAALNANYDVHEVPKLYLTLQNALRRDNRVGLGFLGSRKRVRERTENVKDLLSGALKAEVEAKQKQGKLIGDNPEYRHLMAELKRDNGIQAYYYDMFEMARDNLAEAVNIRSNDPAAHYYYAKVLKLVGRTPEERKLANQEFVQAAAHDTRHQNFGSHLHRALAMMDDKTEANKPQILSELQNYVNNYISFSVDNARSLFLPPNLDTIYDYMTLLGDRQWMPKLPDDAPVFTRVATDGFDSGAGQASRGIGTSPVAPLEPAKVPQKRVPAPLIPLPKK